MGCDIHMNVERLENGQWRFVPPPLVVTKWSPKGRRTWWGDRSYITFAVLAGVRADARDPAPISEPRGYPKDADPKTLKDSADAYRYIEVNGAYEDNPTYEGQDHGDHSHSWLRLDEVFAHNWDQEYEETGVVGMMEYARCKAEGRNPQSWSAWVGGGRTTTMTPTEADTWLKGAEGTMYLMADVVDGSPFWEQGGRYVDMVWTERLEDRCASFLKWARALPALLGTTPDKIRLVFSFDS